MYMALCSITSTTSNSTRSTISISMNGVPTVVLQLATMQHVATSTHYDAAAYTIRTQSHSTMQYVYVLRININSQLVVCCIQQAAAVSVGRRLHTNTSTSITTYY